MAQKLNLEARMTIQELSRRGWSGRQVAGMLRVAEGTVRYHLGRMAEGASDGRARQRHLAEGWEEAILTWLEGVKKDRVNLAVLHEYLVGEHDYPGSLRSIQRYYRRRFPKPRRARRRVETPPGAQAQADWAHFPGMLVGGRERDLYAFHLVLSWSRYDPIVWSESKAQLSWLHVHNEALRRLGGVPAVVRVDNEKTAISHGAGAWGVVNEAYRRYALAARFHVDACQARSPEAKGKVERRVRDQRDFGDPRRRHWDSVEELQEWTDERGELSARRRTCPATGTTVLEAWEEERRYLGALPILPEPFDLVVTRPVTRDCLVAFEGRQYSVPFAWMGQRVEVRGCAGVVQVLGEGQVIARHPRHTRRRLVIDPAHFEGEATADVLPPLPLGKMGRRLQEISAMVPESRPLDIYAALAEVAR